MSFQDVCRPGTTTSSHRMRRNHPPKLPRVKAIPFTPPSNSNNMNGKRNDRTWKQTFNRASNHVIKTSQQISSNTSAKQLHDDMIDSYDLKLSISSESSINLDDPDTESRDDTESRGPDRHQHSEHSSRRQSSLQEKEREQNRRSSFAILTYEMQQYQKLVSDLELLLKDAGESPEAAWRANILVKSVEETDRGLHEKLKFYEKMLFSSPNEKTSMDQYHNDNKKRINWRLAQQQAACTKLQRDYNRSHATMMCSLAIHTARQKAEVSQLGAIRWNDVGTTAPLQQHQLSNEDFFDRTMRQRELERMNQSMRQVNDIYHGLAGLVERQQEQVDQLEGDIDFATVNVKRGSDEIYCYGKRQNAFLCGAMDGCGNDDDNDVAITMSFDKPSDQLRVSENFYWSMPFETMTEDIQSVKNDIVGMGKKLISHGKRFDCGTE
jgi:hypothetical protein